MRYIKEGNPVSFIFIEPNVIFGVELVIQSHFFIVPHLLFNLTFFLNTDVTCWGAGYPVQFFLFYHI
jgi:hypothetical protein